MSRSNDKYVMFKNFLHNELDITREDIIRWINEAIESEVKKIVNNTYSYHSIKEMVKENINSDMNRKIKNELIDKVFKNIKITIEQDIK